MNQNKPKRSNASHNDQAPRKANILPQAQY